MIYNIFRDIFACHRLFHSVHRKLRTRDVQLIGDITPQSLRQLLVEMILIFNLEITVCVLQTFLCNLSRFFISNKYLILVELVDSLMDNECRCENDDHRKHNDDIQWRAEEQCAFLVQVANRHDVVDVASDNFYRFLSAGINDAAAAFVGASLHFEFVFVGFQSDIFVFRRVEICKLGRVKGEIAGNPWNDNIFSFLASAESE